MRSQIRSAAMASDSMTAITARSIGVSSFMGWVLETRLAEPREARMPVLSVYLNTDGLLSQGLTAFFTGGRIGGVLVSVFCLGLITHGGVERVNRWRHQRACGMYE
jgi:hypothetical protein